MASENQTVNKVVNMKVFRRTEGKRIVTIAYIYNKEEQTLMYGASVFQKEGKSTFCRKDHFNTAVDRLVKCPVVINNFEYCESFTKFQDTVRKQLFTHKCKGERV